MINKDFFLALSDLEREKGIKKDVFISTLETALTSACKKNFGEATNVSVKLNPEKCTIRVYKYKNIVSEVVDPDKEISLKDARLVKKSFKLGEILSEEIVPKEFGRIAAQTAKQVVMQRLRETERELAVAEYQQKEDEIITVVVRRVEGSNIFVEMGNSQMEGILMAGDQVRGERYEPNSKLKVYVKRVKNDIHGPQVVVSRSNFGLVKKLFENEVPEIRSNIVEIKGIVREAGYRTKMAVYSNDENVDAVGSCVGSRGARVNAVVSELNGEKIDIIEWSAEPADFIARALSPAKVFSVQADENSKSARVVVPDDKLSLAIGKDGQNARLAARLTGWKIDVKSYSDFVKPSDGEAGDAAEADAADETKIDGAVTEKPKTKRTHKKPEKIAAVSTTVSETAIDTLSDSLNDLSIEDEL
jgi:N utilization substance protein A